MFDLNPYSKSTAVLEIVILLLVAAIIGFVTAWLLFRNRSKVIKEEAEREKAALNKEIDRLKKDCISAETANQLRTENDKYHAKIKELGAKIEGQQDLQTQLSQVRNQMLSKDNDLKALRGELATAQGQLEACGQEKGQLSGEVNRLSLALGACQNELADCKEGPKEAPALDKKAIALAKVAAKRKDINFERIGVASADIKDDLKLISGIGPFIEEKLNALGIYTFLQLTRFTDQDVEDVTKAIEFFPGRIQRDNWIAQAKDRTENEEDKKQG